MKILLATSKAVPSGGGIASYNEELVKILSNHHFYLLTDSDESNVEGYEKTISLYGKRIWSYKVCEEIVNTINNANYDIIVNSRSSIMPVIAPFVNAPIVSVSHFVDGFQADNAGFNSDYISFIIALSHYGKEYLEDKFKINYVDKVRVVYNFVSNNEKKYNSAKEKPLTPIIVFPGGTSRNKSFDLMMIAVKELLKTNLKFKFYWLGSDTLPVNVLSFQRFHNLRQFFQKDSRLIITGIIPRKDAEQIIGSANIFVLPSRGEGCPISLLEAMREGCIPVISDAKHGSLELIEALQCGEIVRNCTGRSLFNRMKYIIENIDDYNSCYKKTYDFSRSYLSQSEWAKQMNWIFSACVSCKKDMIPLTKIRYFKSKIGYLRLYKCDRIKNIIKGLWIRVKLEYYYLFKR